MGAGLAMLAAGKWPEWFGHVVAISWGLGYGHDPPKSQLLFQLIRSAPNMQLAPLQDIMQLQLPEGAPEPSARWLGRDSGGARGGHAASLRLLAPLALVMARVPTALLSNARTPPPSPSPQPVKQPAGCRSSRW